MLCSPDEAQLMRLLLQLIKAKKTIEIGKDGDIIVIAKDDEIIVIAVLFKCHI